MATEQEQARIFNNEEMYTSAVSYHIGRCIYKHEVSKLTERQQLLKFKEIIITFIRSTANLGRCEIFCCYDFIAGLRVQQRCTQNQELDNKMLSNLFCDHLKGFKRIPLICNPHQEYQNLGSVLELLQIPRLSEMSIKIISQIHPSFLTFQGGKISNFTNNCNYKLYA